VPKGLSHIPGPGAYTPNDKFVRHNSPTQRIGTSKRDGLNNKSLKALPGPGTFEVCYDWTKLQKNAGFGSSARGNVGSARGGVLVPGPGNYNPQEIGGTIAPSYSMRAKTAGTSSNHKTPGPGAYQPKIDLAKENFNGVKIGTSTRA
jgi:hypothetical protein